MSVNDSSISCADQLERANNTGASCTCTTTFNLDKSFDVNLFFIDKRNVFSKIKTFRVKCIFIMV